jgi:valyl-tRNA synthetase
MDKTYAPHAIEQHWYDIWEARGYFTAKEEGDSYCIMIPPPNITGNLHMGHAFQDMIMDALIRYHRMQGRSTLWQAGTDHAGIATQMVVERMLNNKGLTRHDLGREKFIEKIWDWKQQSGNTITRQLRRMGASLDWSRERFTMDEGISTAVQEVFIRLYEEGLIYQGKRLVNWDCVLQTAVSDLEVLATEEQGSMWQIRYPLSNNKGYLTVATTRPETMLGDAAIAIHPNDPRYKHLLGDYVEIPIASRYIPIIADEHVDPKFGTGCVKITPAHDFNDYEVWLRHRDSVALSKLPYGGLINIFTEKATIRDNNKDEHHLIPEQYHQLDRFEARKQIVTDLQALNLLAKVDNHRLMIPRGDRSGTIIEPFLTHQWYLNVKPLAKPAIKAVETGAIKFVPDNWKNTYFEWMHNLQDWCISRQIWWGHRIPAWYDLKGNVYVGKTEADIRQQHNLSEDYPLKQDEDVLDTWFSSALWPFSTLGWPEKTTELAQHYPSSVLVTGFDIIFFWVARMIMMGLKFQGEVPFKEVYIHGLVRDADGQKMSKTKGNVLDPLDLIEGIELEALIKKRTTGMMQPHLAEKIAQSTRQQFPNGISAVGTDALRFTFASMASTGRDIRFDLARTEGYRNFCNKLWNAARYVLMNTEDDSVDLSSTCHYTHIDHWIISRLNEVTATTAKAIESYRFDLAAQTLYDFIWNEYCDWYLELSKVVLQADNSDYQCGTRKTLLRVLETSLRLLHPLMPFITEEIWQRVAPLLEIKGDTIMLQPYPKVDRCQINPTAVLEVNWIMDFILGVRKIRGEMNIAPGKLLPVLINNNSQQDQQFLTRNEIALKKIGRLASITQLDSQKIPPEAAIALVGEMKILIPLAGLIDQVAELARLTKEIQKITKELPRIIGKLNNPKFMNKAPSSVIDKEKIKRLTLENALKNLEQEFEKIKTL